MKEALYYRKLDAANVQCLLCPHHCRLKDGETGRCSVRTNLKGQLFAMNYGLFSALHADPIEKKPLYHFYPGSKILSFGSFGCNLQCDFCQNWEISQHFPEYPDAYRLMSASEIVDKAKNEDGNIGIAFTYNEPIVNFEFMLEVARAAQAAGLKTAMITNGFITEAPLKQLIACIDAFNVDLKIFSNHYFQKFAGGRLDPVLRSLKLIAASDKHLEITHLVVTGINDDPGDFENMLDWICKELGTLTILHISRYFPNFRLSQPPTAPALLNYMFDLAKNQLPYTYLGNIILGDTSDTFCHSCQSKVIERIGYDVRIIGLNQSGSCLNCGQKVIKHI